VPAASFSLVFQVEEGLSRDVHVCGTNSYVPYSVQYRENQYLNGGMIGANTDDTASTISKFVPKRRKRQRLFGMTMKSEILV
jgi:hypothetical protein